MHGKSCRDSGQTHGSRKRQGSCQPKHVWKMNVLKTQASSLPVILWDLLPDAEGVQLALHRAPPGVHGRKEAGVDSRRKEEEERPLVPTESSCPQD